MNCTKTRGKKPLKIKRDFEYSRLGSENIATAYEIIFPILSRSLKNQYTEINTTFNEINSYKKMIAGA